MSIREETDTRVWGMQGMPWVGVDSGGEEGVLAEKGQLGKGPRKWRSEAWGRSMELSARKTTGAEPYWSISYKYDYI